MREDPASRDHEPGHRSAPYRQGHRPELGATNSAHHVVVLALPRVVAFDLTIATQVFGHEGHNRYRVTVAAMAPGMVATTSSFAVTADADLSALQSADTVVVPGFARGPAPRTSTDALRAAHHRGARVASICTGAFALAQAGLLDGRRATTHWVHAADLARQHPRVDVDPRVLYVDEGRVLTSAGLAAGMDLCLHMIARDHGEAAAVERARHMVTPRHRAGGQAQFIPPAPAADAGPLAEVTDWACAHLHEPITVADMARRALQAPRTFTRSFTAQMGASPHAWLTTQRLRAACTLLEEPWLTIEEVARRSGMGTPANLRLHFRRAYATNPASYRAAFTGSADAPTHERPRGIKAP